MGLTASGSQQSLEKVKLMKQGSQSVSLTKGEKDVSGPQKIA
jgi:hypothetical protein